jgi:protein O-GlcNAc transferase
MADDARLVPRGSAIAPEGRAALARQQASARVNLALALLRQARPQEALRECEHALLLVPDQAVALLCRGGALQDLGRAAQALASFRRALQIEPDIAALLVGRGNALLQIGRPEDALQCYDCALGCKPDFFEAVSNRGSSLHALERFEEALASHERALALRPGNVLSLVNRGNALREIGRPDEALASYERALQLEPDSVLALYNRGNALLDLQRCAEAAASFEQAVLAQPTLAAGHLNRGNALRRMHRYQEALASYDRALDLDPDSTLALKNRGLTLRIVQRAEEAARDFAHLRAVDPTFDYALGVEFHYRLCCCDWTGYAGILQTLMQSVTAGNRVDVPFTFLAAVDSPAAHLECARIYVADACPPQTPLWAGERDRHDRVRVAYLSADFHDHATAHLAAGLFERHDRSRFEITAISFGPDDTGEMRRRLERSFDHFVDVRSVADLDVAALMRQREIDIAVDLKGFTDGARPQILAYRPAPVQVSYLGYPGTMGAPYIDYIVADRHVIPESSREHYSESVVYLPDCYQVNDRARAIASRTPTRQEVGLPSDGVVFCCFNSTHKITPPVFDVWMRLLRRAEGSVLWLLKDNEAAARNLRREASQRGVAPERLIFAPRMATPEHLARQRLADLFLDTLPYNAHTTASDALWAGLPLLTCTGRTFAARVAASVLQAAGLPELITDSLAEYEERAAKLAHAPAMLAALRSRLALNRDTCPLFDTDRFRRHIEAAYILMWQRLQRGEAPGAFTVPSCQ